MRLKLNRAAALTLTGTAILATLSQVGGAAPRSYIEGQDHENNNGKQVKADDLDTVTDPSKLPKSNFVDSNIHWTTAGWTNTNMSTPVSVQDFKITEDNSEEETPLMQSLDIEGEKTLGWSGSFTLNKENIKKGNNILLASIHFFNNLSKDNINEQPKEALAPGQGSVDITFKGEKIGTITYSQNHANEIDIIFHVKKMKTM